MEKYTELLLQMLAIPAQSRNEESRATFLEHWFLTEGFNVKRIANNLVVTAGCDPAHATLLLNSHLDTVAPGDGWKTDPYQPVSENGRITALGSNDAGGSVVGLIAAFCKLNEMDKADGIVLVISAEEEVSGKNGITAVIPLLKAIRFAVVGEPTAMQPAVAERGLMVVDAQAKGTAGHAARDEGENAIYIAINDIQRIRKLTFDDPSEWLQDPSVNVTMVSAGSAHNVIPATCDFVIDVRSNDRYTNQRLLNLLREQCDSSLKPRSMRLNSSFLSPHHKVFRLLKEMQLNPYGSPTLSDMALLDVPAVKIGPGDSSRSHTANEYIGILEIAQGIEQYIRLIRKIAE
ncbi:MAG: M20/M25/M40 family metallo-hydrolase [Bacteroidales bacterium]|nr:M20/M25/M40 family metallo-hydrolase [Bacteroidales bacterium]